MRTHSIRTHSVRTHSIRTHSFALWIRTNSIRTHSIALLMRTHSIARLMGTHSTALWSRTHSIKIHSTTITSETHSTFRVFSKNTWNAFSYQDRILSKNTDILENIRTNTHQQGPSIRGGIQRHSNLLLMKCPCRRCAYMYQNDSTHAYKRMYESTYARTHKRCTFVHTWYVCTYENTCTHV